LLVHLLLHLRKCRLLLLQDYLATAHM